MIIKLSPVRSDESLAVSVNGDCIILNGVALDFTQLPDGAVLPASAVDSEFVCGDVTRVDGQLHIIITLPHSAEATEAVRFPTPIIVTEDGPVELPT